MNNLVNDLPVFYAFVSTEIRAYIIQNSDHMDISLY